MVYYFLKKYIGLDVEPDYMATVAIAASRNRKAVVRVAYDETSWDLAPELSLRADSRRPLASGYVRFRGPDWEVDA